MQDKTKVEFANTMRGFAAIAVVIGHLLGLFWLHPNVHLLINAPSPIKSYTVPTYVLWLNTFPTFVWGDLMALQYFFL